MIRLKPDEKLKRKVRKHWFILFEHVAVLMFVFLLPFVSYVFIRGAKIPILDLESVELTLAPPLFIFGAALWALLIWMKLASVWTDYYLDLWVVTDKRLLDVEQKGFFHRESATLRVEQIQDVTIEVKGIIATLLNFGNIHVQTAGESREFTIRGIPDPQGLKALILKQHELSIEKE